MPSMLSYYGSKSRLARDIIAEFPIHHSYIEVCGGSAAVLLEKEASKIEVLNDIDGHLVNLYRVLRNEGDELQRLLKLTPYSREEHALCRHSYKDVSLNPVERARRYFVATCQSFSGLVGDAFSRSKQKRTATSFANRVDGLNAVSERLRGVTVENLKAETLIKKYDKKTALFYVDPPYDPTARSAMKDRHGGKYRHEMCLDDHAGLLTALNRAKGKVLLSGYESPLYKRMLRDWRVCWRKNMQQVSAAAFKRPETQRRTEVLWANF